MVSHGQSNMPPDHSKFLYTIVKQLDLKSVSLKLPHDRIYGLKEAQIDWAAVAAQLNITNGHAARMRFSRFKQAMEGVVPAPRKRIASASSRPRKAIKTEKGAGKNRCSDAIKSEDALEHAAVSRIKNEPVTTEETAYPSEDQMTESEGIDGLRPGDESISSLVPSTVTMPTPAASGPSRREFGPFAGAYPPPGVTIPKQEQQQSKSVKKEPHWDA